MSHRSTDSQQEIPIVDDHRLLLNGTISLVSDRAPNAHIRFAQTVRSSQEMKRDLCLWLEEALCKVGKHALGTTRIVVTGQHHEGKYILKVQDNGAGLKPGQGEGTKHCNLLAERLGGQFRRESLP